MTHPTFEWCNQPSNSGKVLGRTQTAPKKKPVPITFSKGNHSSSIASTEKIKRKPGVGRSATA